MASSDGGSVFPAAGKHTYSAGQVVDLKATPASEFYQFVNWTGDTTGIADVNLATTKITMDADASIKANFETLPWDSTITLDFHATMPPYASLAELVYGPWSEAVNAYTGANGGKFNIQWTYGAEPWDESVALEAIGAKISDGGQINGDQFKLGTIGYIPFLWDMEQCAYATHHLFQSEVAQWDKFGQLNNVRILLSVPLQPAEYWGKVQVTQLSDLDGVLVRAEAGEVPTIDALGATPVVGLEIAELAGALQLGTIQGCFVTYDAGAGFAGLMRGGATQFTTEVDLFPRVYVLAINKAVYDGLPAEAKTVLDSFSTPEVSVQYAAAHYAAAAAAKAEVAADRTIDTLSDLPAWKAATAGVAAKWVDDMTALGFDGQGIYDRALELILAAS